MHAALLTNKTLEVQIDALNAAGCERIYEDQGVSGAQIERSGLDRCLSEIGNGDTLVVWKLY